MTFPLAPGAVDYSSSGLSKFSPNIWSAKTVLKLYDATCFTEICNTDYEGEIKDMGDKVTITTVPTLTINKYYKGKKLVNETPESAPVELTIDRGFDFAFTLHDLDKLQAKPNLWEQWTENAAQEMKISINTDVLANVYLDAASYNKGLTAGRKSGAYNLGVSGTPLGITKGNAVDTLAALAAVMDEARVPPEQRWAIIPVWYKFLINTSELKNAAFSGDGVSIARNGLIGEIAGLRLYVDNNVDSVTDGAVTAFHIPFGHKIGFTFATQLVKVRQITLQDDFADACQGVNIYGFETVIPGAIGELYAYKVA